MSSGTLSLDHENGRLNNMLLLLIGSEYAKGSDFAVVLKRGLESVHRTLFELNRNHEHAKKVSVGKSLQSCSIFGADWRYVIFFPQNFCFLSHFGAFEACCFNF